MVQLSDDKVIVAESEEQLQRLINVVVAKGVSKHPVPNNGARVPFFGQAGHADPLDDWQCSS